MRKVITYGTFDLLHAGHINLLRRAKELGDYLIVVVSTDEFNWNEKQKKWPVRRIILFAVLVLVVCLGVAAYVFRDSLNLDAARRFVRYLNVSGGGTDGQFLFDAGNANQYADFDGGLAVARASYIAGASSTSNVLAGKIYGIPVFGTHAHSWVMAFPTELDAFRAFAKSSPKNCCLLLDTYDVRQGIKNAITCAKEMEEAGERLAAVRIDSGDLAKLSKEARAAFDEAGLPYVKVSVSNDLDEYTIQSLFAQGAPIDSFGVGTKLATCDPQPSLGGVYKLSAIRASADEPWRPVIKLSEQAYKRTIPGVQRVLRFFDEAECPVGDMIYQARAATR